MDCKAIKVGFIMATKKQVIVDAKALVVFGNLYTGIIGIEKSKLELVTLAKSVQGDIHTRAEYEYALNTLKEKIGYDKLPKAGKEQASNRFRYMRVTLFPWIPALKIGASVTSHNKGTGKQAEAIKQAIADSKAEASEDIIPAKSAPKTTEQKIALGKTVIRQLAILFGSAEKPCTEVDALELIAFSYGKKLINR